jgi:uncharacterized protein YjdB
MHVLRGLSVVALIAAAGLAACKEATDPEPVASIVGMNPTDSVRLGKTITFQIETRDAKGNKLTGRKVTWSSLNPNVATVDANGTVTGIVIGSTIITARADGATSQTDVKVQPLVASVVLSPSSATVPIGSNRALTVTVSDKNGLALAGRAVAFSSSNPNIATVNSSGVVVGVSVGRAVINAEAIQDQVSGTATIDVVQAPVASVSISPAGAQTVFQGLTLQLSATLRDGNNPPNILTGRPISWTTSNQAVATVSSTGLVTGIGLGSAQITAESEGVTSSTTVTVAPPPVATVSLTPNPGTVKMGQFLQMTLELRDASGNQLTTTGRTVVWDSSNRPVATVQDGVVSGVTQGNATITVTVDGKSASALLTVTP